MADEKKFPVISTKQEDPEDFALWMRGGIFKGHCHDAEGNKVNIVGFQKENELISLAVDQKYYEYKKETPPVLNSEYPKSAGSVKIWGDNTAKVRIDGKEEFEAQVSAQNLAKEYFETIQKLKGKAVEQPVESAPEEDDSPGPF